MAQTDLENTLINSGASVLINSMEAQTKITTQNAVTARLFNDSDYPMIEAWWNHHRKDVLQKDALSSIGIIVERDYPEAVGFLYTTNSKRCMLDFVISNPAANKKNRSESLDILNKALCEVAEKMGFLVAEITVKIPTLINRCETWGYTNLGECKYMARAL